MSYTATPGTITNVLVAEDDNLVAEGIKRVFEQRGAHVIIASNGYDATNFIQSEDFLDLAIVDSACPKI